MNQDIRTASGRTNRPINRLYPLEIQTVSKNEQSKTHKEFPVNIPRATRKAAKLAIEKIHKIYDGNSSSDDD